MTFRNCFLHIQTIEYENLFLHTRLKKISKILTECVTNGIVPDIMVRACEFVHCITFERNKVNIFWFVNFLSSSTLFVVNKIIGNAINLVDRVEGGL
jgi:hypothetical protein